MRADALFVLTAIAFIFIAWVATGGPTRPIAQEGPFITAIHRPGETSQGYNLLVPTNPLDINAYPRQVGGATATIDTQTSADSGSSASAPVINSTYGSPYAGKVYIEHSTLGPAAGTPDQEYVRLVNQSGQNMSLAGWRLSGRAGGSLIVPGIAVVPSGTSITLVTGSRTAASAPICPSYAPCTFLGLPREVWSQANETITLYDALGKSVDSFSY